MTYDRQFLEIQWLFGINSTDEVADTGLKATGGTTSYDAVAGLADLSTADLNAFHSQMVTLMQGGGVQWADYSQSFGVKVAACDVNGHYLTDPRVSTDATTVGTIAQVYPQLSVVASLRSGGKIGVANYGRMYLPHSRLTLQTGSPYASSVTTALQNGLFKTFLTSVNTITNSGPQPSIVQLMSSKGSGTTKPILQIECGNVTDTQRRRYNRLSVTRNVLAFP